MEKTKSKSMAEEWNRLRDWDLTLGDVVRRVVAVGAGLVVGTCAGLLWLLAVGLLLNTAVNIGYLLGGLFVLGLALLATCGVAWLVWAIWTDEL